jgi:hypothetical protein
MPPRGLTHQPIGERAGGRHADLLALELGGGSGAVGPHHNGEQERRPGHGGDRLDRRALDDERHRRAGAERDVETVGRHRLLHARVAGKCDRLDVEPVVRKQAFAYADVERHERERLGHRLADPQRLGGARAWHKQRTAREQQQRGDKEAQRRVHRHGPSPPFRKVSA